MSEDSKAIEHCAKGPGASSPRGEGTIPSTDTTIGDLVAAVFDEASHYTADLRSLSQLATQAVVRLLRRSRSKLHLADAEQRATPDGCRFAPNTKLVPIAAQIRVAVYAASVVVLPAKVDPSPRSDPLGNAHDIRQP